MQKACATLSVWRRFAYDMHRGKTNGVHAQFHGAKLRVGRRKHDRIIPLRRNDVSQTAQGVGRPFSEGRLGTRDALFTIAVRRRGDRSGMARADSATAKHDRVHACSTHAETRKSQAGTSPGAHARADGIAGPGRWQACPASVEKRPTPGDKVTDPGAHAARVSKPTRGKHCEGGCAPGLMSADDARLRALERRALSFETEDAAWRGGLPVLGFWSSLRPRPGGCGVPNGDDDAARSRCMVARGGASAGAGASFACLAQAEARQARFKWFGSRYSSSWANTHGS